jgi:hypothetical protein
MGNLIGLLAISLSACASASGTTGPGPDTHSAQYQRGYRVGEQARLRYGIRPGYTVQDLAAFCDETAYLDIQPMKGPLVLWSEGFDAGCRSAIVHSRFRRGRLEDGFASTGDRVRRRPTGTIGPR